MNFLVYILIGFVVAVPLRGEAITVENRIEENSKIYLGYPYLKNPLGEGFGYDKDPLYNLNGFDCVTYVETVLALSTTDSEEEFKAKMNEIRYKDGDVNFLNRNHITSIDWNINNEANGILIDKTVQLFPKNFKILETEIDKGAWFQKTHNLSVNFPKKISRLPYLPINSIIKETTLLNRIRSGSIINIVRSNWPLHNIGTRLDISHQGFAIRKNGVLYFREASSLKKMVVEIPMQKYISSMKNVNTVRGINILEPQNL
jgi:hypothetical protein